MTTAYVILYEVFSVELQAERRERDESRWRSPVCGTCTVPAPVSAVM